MRDGRGGLLYNGNVPAPIELQSLNHVTRVTHRYDESLRFYTEVLGFRVISRPNFPFDGAWLYAAGMQIHLIVDPSPAPAVHTDINTRTNHIAFFVDDVDAMEQRLREHGVTYKRNIIPDRQIHQLFFHDPDGHMIELGHYGIIDQ